MSKPLRWIDGLPQGAALSPAMQGKCPDCGDMGYIVIDFSPFGEMRKYCACPAGDGFRGRWTDSGTT